MSVEVLSKEPKSPSLSREDLKEQTLIASWLSQKKPDTTGRNYAREVRHFFSLFPNLRIKDIEVSHISIFLKSREHLSSSSKKKSKDSLSSLLSFCVKVGYLDRNPAFALDRIPVAETIGFRILSEEQVMRLIHCESQFRNRLLLKLLYYSGIRVSELCSLQWKNFSPRTRGQQLTVVGKGHKTRSILISEEFWEEFEALRSQQIEMGAEISEASPIFRSQMEPYNSIKPNQVRRIVRRAAEKAGLPEEVSPHWLRHCHATHALERGAPIHIVQKTLGHASLTTTGKYLDARPLDSSSQYLIGSIGNRSKIPTDSKL